MLHVSRMMQKKERDFFLKGINSLCCVMGKKYAYYEVGTDFVCDMHKFVASRRQ
jgi:hypothetical protein